METVIYTEREQRVQIKKKMLFTGWDKYSQIRI